MRLLSTLIHSPRTTILSLAALGLTACACSVYAAAGGNPGAPAAQTVIDPFSLQPLTLDQSTSTTTTGTSTTTTGTSIGTISPGPSGGGAIFTRPPTRNPFRPPVRSPFVPGPPI